MASQQGQQQQQRSGQQRFKREGGERSDGQRRDALQTMSQNDNSALAELLRIRVEENIDASGLDARSYAIANLGALIAIGGDLASFAVGVDRAVSSGASADEVLGVLVAVAPTVGVPRVVSAAPDVAAALEIELDMDDDAARAGGSQAGGGGSQPGGRSGS